eukprot:1357308-Prymnesium_polylepis.2
MPSANPVRTTQKPDRNSLKRPLRRCRVFGRSRRVQTEPEAAEPGAVSPPRSEFRLNRLEIESESVCLPCHSVHRCACGMWRGASQGASPLPRAKGDRASRSSAQSYVARLAYCSGATTHVGRWSWIVARGTGGRTIDVGRGAQLQASPEVPVSPRVKTTSEGCSIWSQASRLVALV